MGLAIVGAVTVVYASNGENPRVRLYYISPSFWCFYQALWAVSGMDQYRVSLRTELQALRSHGPPLPVVSELSHLPDLLSEE